MGGRTRVFQFPQKRLSQFLISLHAALHLLCFSTGAAIADYLPRSGAEVANNIAEIRVENDGVYVQLEVFVRDASKFEALIPDEWFSTETLTRPTEAQRLSEFTENGLTIRRSNGKALPVRIERVEQRLRIDRTTALTGLNDPVTNRKFPEPPEDPRVVYVELFYDFEGTRPDTIAIAPPIGPSGIPGATIGFVTFDRGVMVANFAFLSAPAILTLDWSDPWNSSFDNPNLIRHHRYPRMVFLYAEPYEIRQEALVRVRDAAELVGLNVPTRKLAPDQARSLAKAAVDEIAQRSRMTINDKPVVPDYDRSAFMRIGMRGLEFLEQGETVDVDADILGLIWSAPVDGLPRQAQVEWDWFDETAPEIAAYSIDAAGPFLSSLTKDAPILVWKNHFKVNPNPDVTAILIEQDRRISFLVYVLGCMGFLGVGLAVIGFARRETFGVLPTYAGFALAFIGIAGVAFALQHDTKRVPNLGPEELATLSERLLNNVYRAFNFRTEAQVYDRLALTLDDDALEEVYLAQRDALRIDRAGGAEARVTELDVRETILKPNETGAFRLQTDWTVTGQVGHWGHAHSRTNAYLAELVIAPVDGSWKILDFDVLRQDRLQ
ncbi:hypothetical protein [Ruegeria profundi]|uniref:hypothetical protein n=1 Tax=Ruegeria profundi TaxID=1685378 RepID=UPI001CD1D118|nr:hypothetical protein [Ruegeria profundi]MCA0930768.1 hypothetical protein [Ruegeria profundi]